MTNIDQKLRLKEMAEEDIFFARRDRELIEALHERRLAEHLELDAGREKKKAANLEEKFASANVKHRREPWSLGRRYRALIRNARKLIER